MAKDIFCQDPECGLLLNPGAKFCYECGFKQKQVSKQVASEYANPYGLWAVSTEGDEEGRSIRHLGTHEGYADEIAAKLASSCFYSLTFRKEAPLPKDFKKPKSVSMKFDIGSKTWDMDAQQRIQAVKEVFKDRPVEVSSSNYYVAFSLIFKG